MIAHFARVNGLPLATAQQRLWQQGDVLSKQIPAFAALADFLRSPVGHTLTLTFTPKLPLTLQRLTRLLSENSIDRQRLHPPYLTTKVD